MADRNDNFYILVNAAMVGGRLAQLPISPHFARMNNWCSIYGVADTVTVSQSQALTWLREGMGRRPGLAPFPEYVSRFGLKLLGKAEMAQSLFDNLEIDSSRFMRDFGWKPPVSVRDAMIASGRAVRSL